MRTCNNPWPSQDRAGWPSERPHMPRVSVQGPGEQLIGCSEGQRALDIWRRPRCTIAQPLHMCWSVGTLHNTEDTDTDVWSQPNSCYLQSVHRGKPRCLLSLSDHQCAPRYAVPCVRNAGSRSSQVRPTRHTDRDTQLSWAISLAQSFQRRNHVLGRSAQCSDAMS